MTLARANSRTWNQRKHRVRGVTIIELVVVLAIAAILMGIGAPSFVSALKNNRLSSGYHSMTSAFFLARSEAVKRSNHVSVCARSSDSSCGTDWSNGWLVFTDNFGPGLNEGVVDAADTILAINAPVSEDIDIEAIGRRSGSSTSTAQSYIRYTNRGSANWQGGTITLCDDRGEDYAHAINIMLTGDVRRARPATDSTVPLDISGVAVECP